MNYDEKTLSKEIIYNGGIIDVEKQIVKLHNGKEASRDIVRHPGASVIIPIDDEWNIYFVKQFRKPIEKNLIEIPAGKLDKNEDPKKCAIRELKEETGIIARKFEHLYSLYTSPAVFDEILHFYIALDLSFGESNTDEDEFLEIVKININEAVKMVKNGDITDIKTVNGIQFALMYKNGIMF